MTINCKGKLIDFQRPKIMGIVNLTTDSFYSGSRFADSGEGILLETVGKMLVDGADFIDIGAYSTRPGADDVPVELEMQRVVAAVSVLCREFPEVLISVDTFRAAVADAAISEGAALINDVTAGLGDSEMLAVIAKHQVPYVMMHMRGTPKTMTQLNQYDDLVGEVLMYFSERIAAARALGINDLILDPGFGFAKNVDQNFTMLQRFADFKIAGVPLLAGISRKSMIYKTLGTTADQALNGTTFLHAFALQGGANILRVHDVKEAVEAVSLFEKLQS
ncbi:dihydropteroate synthase [Flavobacterium aurantiibacter]|uniref:dihydropteroate synthase n=1 Tax=Flavobacterium aurantiibacter TaxID=2023067 RepID=A0A255ZSL0_9FLAO|nr:dihydropteroate synthase [Flavobacterium aurantiibacter]OYQ44421.1 dihydropteroate synthase [Flavobacterium aurantiibacter]